MTVSLWETTAGGVATGRVEIADATSALDCSVGISGVSRGGCVGGSSVFSVLAARPAKAYPVLMPSIAVVESPTTRILADRAGGVRRVFFFACAEWVVIEDSSCKG